MTTWLTRCFALLLLVLPFVPVVAVDPDDAEIARLVEQLGSAKFKERKAASKRLAEIGEPALDALHKAATSDDPEVRCRAKDIVAVLENKLYGAELRLTGHTARVMGVAFSPDGRRLLSSSNDGTVRLLDAGTGKLIHTLAHPCARSVAFSPDGKKAVSTGDRDDQTVRLWDLETGKELKCFAGYPSPISGVAFSADGTRVLFGVFSDRTMRLLDVESGKEIKRFEGHTGGVHGIALSADGKWSLSGSYDSTVRLWDNETGKELKRLEGHKGGVAAVALSPDGKRAVAGGGDHAIKLWDLETGKEIRQMEAHANVHALAFSRDGRRIASANYEGHSVSLWDAETGKELYRFAGHTADVYDVAFSPDGRFLVSGGDDNTVRVWRMPR